LAKLNKLEVVAALGRTFSIGSLYSSSSDTFIDDSSGQLDLTTIGKNSKTTKINIESLRVALGRTFGIGSLNSSRSLIDDSAVQSDLKTIGEMLETTKINQKSLKMVSSETFEDRAKAISMNESERLSVMCNMLPLSGAAKFFSGFEEEPNTVLVTFKFDYRSELKLCDVSKLKSITSGLPSDVTHVVAGIQSGYEAFYVFQRKLEGGMSTTKTMNKMELIVLSHIGSTKPKAADNNFCEGISCKVFCDSQEESASISFSDAIESIKLLSETVPKSIPKFALLHRVNTLGLQVDSTLVAKVEQLVSDYLNVEEKLAEFRNLFLLEEIEGEAGLLEHLIKVARGYLSDDLGFMGPEIRKSTKTWNELDALVDMYRNSSFSPDQIERCFSGIFSTAAAIDRMIKTAKSENVNFVADSDFRDLVSRLSEGDKLVTFAFNTSALSSKVLPKLKLDVLSQDKIPPEENVSNLEVDVEEMEKMLGVFLQYNESNLSSGVKYILISNESENDSPSSVAEVFLYNSGSRCSIKLPCGLEVPKLTGKKGRDWVEIVLQSPKFGKELISEFRLSFLENGQERRIFFPLDVADQPVKVSTLLPAQKYVFRVQVVSSAGLSPPSDWSEEVTTDAEIRLAMKILVKSDQVGDSSTPLYVYKPRGKKIKVSDGLKKIEIGNPDKQIREKTILVVSAIETEKTKFLNSMVNYLYDVRQEDQFRFKIVIQDDDKDISAYCFNETKLPYRLVVVDIPRYGDIDGLAANKRTTSLVKDLFENHGENGIDHLDAVCIVVKATDTKLTAQQRQNFNSVLQLFGKDVKPNLFIIAMSCSPMEPPVKACLRAADIDFTKFFMFNNSAFFEGIKNKSENEQVFQSLYWQIGQTSFNNFFSDLENTTQVRSSSVQQRHLLETLLLELRRKAELEISRLEQLHQEAQVMESFEAQIKANEPFTYTIRELKVVQEDISRLGIHTMTCMTCNFTCLSSCDIDNKDMAGCVAMERPTGDCLVCPQHCHWDKHKSVPYICKIVEEEVIKTDEDLRTKYLKATDDNQSKELMIKNLGEMFAKLQKEHSWTIYNIRRIIEKLQVAIVFFIFSSVNASMVV
jgi:hypothetical protein